MMLTAMVALTVVVVVAMGVGVKAELSGQIICYCRVCRAADPAKQLDACLCKGVLCPGADAAAKHHIGIVLGQKAHQCTVPLPVGRDHLSTGDAALLGGVKLELRGVAEVLEHLTVFIRNCDLHTKNSFLCTGFSFPILTDCAGIGKGTRAFCAFWGGKHGRYVKVISETAVKCIIIEPEKRVKV